MGSRVAMRVRGPDKRQRPVRIDPVLAMRAFVVLASLSGCERAKPSPSPPPSSPEEQLRGDHEHLVTETQHGPVTEKRTSLACAMNLALSTAHTGPNENDALVAAVMSKVGRHALEDESTLSPAERDLWLLEVYRGEVSNGGHNQFFFNTSGDNALATRAAIVRLGLTDMLSIYDCALSAFPDGKPDPDRQRRYEQLASWGDNQFSIFEPLDRAEWKLDTIDATGAYIRAHAAELPKPK